MSISIDQFFAVKGSRFNNSDAQVIGPVLTAHYGKPASALWEHAKKCDKDDPFRGYFQWDKNKALEEVNISRAQEMQRGITIRYVTVDGGMVEARQTTLVPVTVMDPADKRVDKRGNPVKVMVPTAEAMQEPRMASHILSEIHSSLFGLCNKYRVYKDLIGAPWRTLEAAVEAFQESGAEDTG